MKRVIQVKSKKTGMIYELLTNDRCLTPFDVLEFHGIVQKPKRICDREKGYSLIEKNKCLEDEDFIVVKDEEMVV